MAEREAMLSIVATPIGNLEDMSPRARQTLAQADLIAAEDTRHSRRLTSHLGIATPMMSLHEHNEHSRVGHVLDELSSGQHIALISDAGTPLISDPGYLLVRAARKAGYIIEAVPGPSALMAAVSIAGLPTDRFVYEGFLPYKATARRARLEVLSKEQRTVVCYESSHRIQATARDLADIYGQRPLVAARELTKRHEQSVELRAEALSAWLTADSNRCRGEFVLVLSGREKSDTDNGQGMPLDPDALLKELLALTGTRQAAAAVSRLTGVKKNQAYQRALALKQ